MLLITSSARGGPWLHLRSSPEWVARCWDWRDLLPAGRNLRVSMMVQCFGIYMFVLTFNGFGYMRRGTYLCFGAGMSLFSCLVSRKQGRRTRTYQHQNTKCDQSS